MKRKIKQSILMTTTLTLLMVSPMVASSQNLTASPMAIKFANESKKMYVNDMKSVHPIIFFNGKLKEIKSEIKNYKGTIYLPFREVGELIGANINYVAPSSTIKNGIAQFEKDGKKVEIINQTAISVVTQNGGEPKKVAIKSSSGQEIPAINFVNQVYVPLRYISEIFNINIDYSNETGKPIIEIYTTKDKPKREYNFAMLNQDINEDELGTGQERWSSVIATNIYDSGNNTFTVVDYDFDGKLTVIAYDANAFKKLNQKEVPKELGVYGGFFSGKKFNFIVYGQDNEEKNDNKEVIRVVKYDKNFNRIGSVSLNGKETYTVEPFHASSLRMAEHDNILIVDTGRLRYDGHQSNLPIIIDTNNMKVLNTIGAFPENHVSHSFNQFVKYDKNNDSFAFLEHGDGYPRAVVLNFLQNDILKEKFNEKVLIDIPGETGTNQTGLNIGGFEVTDDGYIFVTNMIDYSKAIEFDSFDITYKDGYEGERNIVLGIAKIVEREKIVEDENEKGKVECFDNWKNKVDCTELGLKTIDKVVGLETKQISITDYIGKNKTASVPKLVKIDNNKFAVLWQEFDNNNSFYNNIFKYMFVDANGNKLGDLKEIKNVHMTATEPIVLNGNILLPIKYDLNDGYGKRDTLILEIPVN